MVRKSSALVLMLVLFSILASCSPLATDYRMQGFKLSQKAFQYFDPSPALDEVVELKNIRIHIVGSRRLFPWEKAAAEGSRTLGYATPLGEIYVIGKRVGDKIVINQAILGHEINHLLNFADPKIADPDTLNRLEYCHFNSFKGNRC